MGRGKTKRENGEGTLYFDESSKVYRCQVSYYTPDGKLKRKSFTGKTKSIVRERKNTFLMEISLGNITSTSSCSVLDLLAEAAHRDFQLNAIGKAAFTRRMDTIHVLEKSQLWHQPITSVTVEQINQYFLQLKVQYSNSVIGKCFSSISKAYNIAIDKQILTRNLMKSTFVRKPISDKPDRIVRAFTVQEEKQFLNALKQYKPHRKDYDLRLALIISLYSGLRIGEVCALAVNDIDFEQNVIHVNGTITRGLDYGVELGTRTKTKNGMRSVPIDQVSLAPLLRYAISVRSKNQYNLLFYNTQYDCFCRSTSVNTVFQLICQRAGIQNEGGSHVLRHTFATRCIEAGVGPETLRTWLGHKDVSTTINTYINVFQKHQDKQMQKVMDFNKDEFLNMTTHLADNFCA